MTSEPVPASETSTKSAQKTEKTDAPEKTLAKPPEKSKKKKSRADLQKELRDLSKGSEERPPVDTKKMYFRVGAVVVAFWLIALFVPSLGWAPKAVAGVVTLIAIGGVIWFQRYMKKTQALGDLLRGADTDEGRKDALKRIDSDFKKDDVQAAIAKAQLQMQDAPRDALETLEGIKLDKQMAPVAAQIRAMRAMIHLTLGEIQAAKPLADALDLGKQQEPKTRAMFAAVASETWARTGQGKKAVDTLELFNPDAADLGEVRAQMWRARAFAYAATNDMKGASRALKKLSDMNPHLLGMFIGTKKIHPLLEREAKQIAMKTGAVPRKMVVQRK